MKDISTYLKDSYIKELESTIQEISIINDDRVRVILADTIFYPEGGGQPCDQGEIVGSDGNISVSEVKYENGSATHYGSLTGKLESGEKVICKIDWDRRYHNMIVHTAGHVVDEVLYEMALSPDKLKPIKAMHGKKPFIEYAFISDDVELDTESLSDNINKFILSNKEISFDFVTSIEELKEKSRFTLMTIPKNKPLRVVRFGGQKGIPDGGTMLKNTNEIPGVEIINIESDNEILRIYYKVTFNKDSINKPLGENTQVSTKDQSSKEKDSVAEGKPKSTVSLIHKFEEIESVLNKALVDFQNDNIADFEELKKKYLGKNGIVKGLLRTIGQQDKAVRADYGAAVNMLYHKVEQLVATADSRAERVRLGSSLTKEAIDVTAPFQINSSMQERPALISKPGTLHPITQIGEKALDVFRSMGFHVTESRRLDDDYNVFEALNLPKGHPARDMWDTFWTEDELIPITHTSSMQNRIIKNNEIPIREVIVGRCFRNEATDASHEHTFYQVEGIYVDKGIVLSDLIGTLSAFMNEFYGQKIKYRIQPSYFPFVEPGLEFLIECLICGQKGCPFCGYSGWVEVIPCGMIHPNVLKYAGRDPEVYSGFAWGLGYDRLVMLGSQIQDIRNIHSGNIKFLGQFK